MIKNIINFFSSHKEVNWSQEEREACLKLLILIMYCDGKISEDESQQVRDNINSFDWRGVHHEDYFVNNIITRVRDLNNEKDQEYFIRECTSVLEDDEVKSEIVKLCSELVKADGEKHEAEIKLVTLIQKEMTL